MKESAPITMKDIARELGVSVATVSRALKDSPRISMEKRTRIKAFAQEHNFFPNVIAESLRNSRTKPVKLIGVIIPQLTHFYSPQSLAVSKKKHLPGDTESWWHRAMKGMNAR